MAQPRRFPPPWTVEELDACFVVIDSAEQKLAVPRLDPVSFPFAPAWSPYKEVFKANAPLACGE
jgi:hypothetical protein